MKKKIITMLMTVMAVLAISVSAYAKNLDELHNTLNLETSIQTMLQKYPNARPIAEDISAVNVANYYLLDEYEFLGEKVTMAHFEFVDNKLYRVNLRFNDLSRKNAKLIKNKLFRQYGKGNELLNLDDAYEIRQAYDWKNDDVRMVYNYSINRLLRNDSGFSVIITHKKLAEKVIR